MIKIPGMSDSGLKTSKLVEMVDIFPTLVEAAGFDPLDLCPEDSHDVLVYTSGFLGRYDELKLSHNKRANSCNSWVEEFTTT